MKKTLTWIIVSAALISAASYGGYVLYQKYSASDAPVFKRTVIKKGELLASISATGTVEPEEVIDVGAQVAGQILSFGQDKSGNKIDYGSIVEEGTVLARIDNTLYEAEMLQAKAQLEQAKAALKKAEADLVQNKAKLSLAQGDWTRAQKLRPTEALAESSYESYKSAYETAVAAITVSESVILQEKANILHDEAALKRTTRNLEYCTIKSPVKGIVIDRRVNIGQTVVASLNAPSLFLIAKDLTKMQVWVAVNEADIGKVYPGQPVRFTIDAFPGEKFKGTVSKIRLNASMTQNVVTYTVEVITDNSSGKLLPYLTASVLFELENLKDVYLVPNSALRWMPKKLDMVAPQYRQSFSSTQSEKGSKGSQAKATEENANSQTQDIQELSGKKKLVRKNGILWVPEGEQLKPLKVKVGASDGIMSEISGDDLAEGIEIVTGLQSQAQAATETVANPFVPQPGRNRR